MSQAYTLFYMDLSYYSGKIQSYLRYKGIPTQEKHVNWWMMANHILPNTGMMEVPVLQSPDGEWLRDSTSLIFHLEKEYPEGNVIPEDPYHAFFNYLLEDYADEWLWRPAMHYRWSYAKDRRLYERRFTEDFMLHPMGTKVLTRLFLGWRQKREYVRKDGISRDTREHVESTYLDTLDRMEAILQKRDFLFGDKPSIADFGFMASMYRHFSLDPTPARIMRERAPGVYAWVARMWNAQHKDYSYQSWASSAGKLPEDWEPLLDHIGNTYLPYLAANADALLAGQERFDVTIEGVIYKGLATNRYRVWCLEKLITFYKNLPDKSRQDIQATLVKHGCREHLWPYRDLQSKLHDGDILPHCTALPTPLWKRLIYYVTGTPRHDYRGLEN